MSKEITFVIPVYKKPYALAGILSSLMAQTNENWRAICVFDGDDAETKDNAKYAAQHLQDWRVTTVYAPYRGEWGHPAREHGLSLCQTDYVCLTGHDNYYLPIFVDAMLNMLSFCEKNKQKISLVYCDFLHLGDNNHPAGGYKYFPSALWHGLVDMGSVVVNAELAKQVGFGQDFRTFEADYHWFCKIQEVSRETHFAAKAGAGHILYVHN